MKEARTIVEERRSAVVMGIRGESGRDGVFQWVSGPPTAGKPATLAYNKNSGGLRNSQVPHSNHQDDMCNSCWYMHVCVTITAASIVDSNDNWQGVMRYEVIGLQDMCGCDHSQ